MSMSWRDYLGTRGAMHWKIHLGPDWAHHGTERKLKIFDDGPLDTAEQFVERLERAKIDLIRKGDSAANPVELYILRVQAAELRYQSNARIFELKNEANALACEMSRLREQAGEFEVLSQVLFEEQQHLHWLVCVIRACTHGTYGQLNDDMECVEYLNRFITELGVDRQSRDHAIAHKLDEGAKWDEWWVQFGMHFNNLTGPDAPHYFLVCLRKDLGELSAVPHNRREELRDLAGARPHEEAT